MQTSSLSRRQFARLLGAGAAIAAARPAMSWGRAPEASPAALATGIVRLSSNENPYGPAPSALRAITDSFNLACRYPDEHAESLVEALAKMDGVASEQVLLGDGSGEILKLCAAAFNGPGTAKSGAGRGALVVADPTFEAIAKHAEVAGAEVVKVPLRGAAFTHDLAKMGAAAKGGLVYICNPNNPTASITPKNEVRDFIQQTPADTMILVDEA